MPGPPLRPDAGATVPLSPIGYVETGYAHSGQTPPQSTLAYGEQGRVVLFERFAEGLRGLAAPQHVWLLTWLHDQSVEQSAPLQVVPRGWEGTGRTTGVFSTRAPHRHNRLGLSLVRLRAVEGNVVCFDGVDLVDGTPVLDIKPWSSTSDLPPEGQG